MADHNPMATQLAALRSTVVVNPPGVTAAYRTVAKRHRRRLGLALLTPLMIGVASIPVSLSQRYAPPDVSTTPSVSDSPGATSAPATVQPSDQPSVQAPTSVPGGTRARSTWPATGRATCTDSGVSSMIDNGPGVGADVWFKSQICPGGVRLFWASYSIDDADVQHLYRSGSTIVDQPNARVHLDYAVPTVCKDRTWYFLVNPGQIPGRIPAATTRAMESGSYVDPFANRSAAPGFPTGIVMRIARRSCPGPPSSTTPPG